jgi:hypothetical protein
MTGISAQGAAYEKPAVDDYGSLIELTAAVGGNGTIEDGGCKGNDPLGSASCPS